MTDVVDMVHFDVDETLEEITRQRFSMPPEVIAAFRQAGGKMAARLLHLVMDDEAFNALNFNQQMQLADRVFDRAYGKSETASSSMMTMHRTGEGTSSQHGEQVKQITERMKARDEGLPEMTRAERATRRAARRGAIPASRAADKERRARAIKATFGEEAVDIDDVPVGEVVELRSAS